MDSKVKFGEEVREHSTLVIEKMDVSQFDEISLLSEGNGNPDSDHRIIGIKIGNRIILSCGEAQLDDYSEVIEV